MMITICFMVIITLLGNIGTIVAFWKVRSLREKPSDFFILNLSCADLIMGLVHILSISTYAAGYWIWGKTGCQLYATVANITVSGGLWSTFLICWDRYMLISVQYPKYMKLQSKGRVISIITALWCYIIISAFIEWMIWDTVKVPQTLYKFDYSRHCRSPPKHNFIFQTQGFSRNIFLPLILIEGFSVAFVVRLRRKLRRGTQISDFDFSSSAQGPQPGGSSTNRRNVLTSSTIAGASTIIHASKMDSANSSVNARIGGRTTRNTAASPQNRYVKAAITLAALVIALNVCVLPFVLYTLYVSLVCPICNNGLIRDFLSLIVIPMNSCINPILYAATMSKIKQFYLKMFRLNN